MDKIKIAVLDTGVSAIMYKNYPVIDSYEWKNIGNKMAIVKSEGLDTFGHGTAVVNIISTLAENAEIINFRITDRRVNCVGLTAALEYIFENIDVDIINISAGVMDLADSDDMRKICEKISLRDTLILSGFDKSGDITYPAAFDSVLGISVSNEPLSNSEIKVSIAGTANMQMTDILHRTVWINGEKALLKGSSFACARMTGILANIIFQYQKRMNVAEIVSLFMHENKL